MIVASWRDLKLFNAIKDLKGRGIAQLVERRSPKPQVPGSSPGAPAIRCKAQESLHNL